MPVDALVGCRPRAAGRVSALITHGLGARHRLGRPATPAAGAHSLPSTSRWRTGRPVPPTVLILFRRWVAPSRIVTRRAWQVRQHDQPEQLREHRDLAAPASRRWWWGPLVASCTIAAPGTRPAPSARPRGARPHATSRPPRARAQRRPRRPRPPTSARQTQAGHRARQGGGGERHRQPSTALRIVVPHDHIVVPHDHMPASRRTAR